MMPGHATTPRAEEAPPDGWPAIARLIDLAFSHDADVAQLASQEILDRIDMPALPLAHAGRRRVIRRTEEKATAA